MSFFSDIEDMVPFIYIISCFSMNLFYEWTRCINPTKSPFSEFLEVTWPCAMCGYDDKSSHRNSIKIGFENHSLSLKHLYHVAIVNNLMIDVDRWRIARYNIHEHPDSSMDSGTITSRKCSKNSKLFHEIY